MKNFILNFINTIYSNNQLKLEKLFPKTHSKISFELFLTIKDNIKNFIVFDYIDKEFFLKNNYFLSDTKNCSSFISNYLNLKSGSKIEFQKNSSLLIFLKLENLKEENELKNKIILTEEDPYYFNKMIFTYTEKQIEILKNKNFCSLKELLNCLFDVKLFEIYNNADLNNENLGENILLYDFLIKLFVKIPFFTLDLNKLKNSSIKFNSVEKEVSQILKKNKLDVYYDQIIKIKEKINFENDEELLKTLEEIENDK